ncbi:MAG TPA: 50S ribosomal protein L17 [Candidatus Cloacimonadota bacterium]|nr:50S ribosomal protein L17 [Candidatus Cloacimonadota bacterium]HPT72878.1 50S ribosomal protein L17 [Candidatus Cloacimonadota bacterium]
MRHRVAGRKFGREADHRKAMLKNLVRSLVEHERLTTTVEKAKEMRSLAERCITYAKADTVHHRRMAYIILGSRDLVKKLFTEIAPRYTERNGGYTRIIKNGYRKGDAAAMAIIEFVEGTADKKHDHIKAKDLAKDTEKHKPVKKVTKSTKAVKEETPAPVKAAKKAVATEPAKVEEVIKAAEPEKVEEVVEATEPETVEEVVETVEPEKVEEVAEEAEKPAE